PRIRRAASAAPRVTPPVSASPTPPATRPSAADPMTTTVRPPVGQWHPALSSTLADRALSVAMDVAERVRGAERHDRPESPLAGKAFGHGVQVNLFDVIAGAAGTVPYLLDSGMEPELRHLLANLVDVCGHQDGRQNWHTPHDLIMNPLTAKHYPGGNLNCGLS